MAEIRRLDPHAALPDSNFVAVLRRFDEDDPRRLMVETVVSFNLNKTITRPQRENGFFMEFDEAIQAACRMADDKGINEVHVIDRTAGPREREILAHNGDHSVHMDSVEDMDLEHGERGPDMRR